MLLNRKNHCSKSSVGVAVAVLAAAHIAAGVLLCKGMCCHSSSLGQMAKKAKRNVWSVVREIF